MADISKMKLPNGTTYNLKDARLPTTATIQSTPIASFSDGADNVPVKSLIASINAVQSGSGTPSPTNVRAISGWSSCNLTRTGKNLFQQIDGTQTYEQNGATFTWNGSHLQSSGTATSGWITQKNILPNCKFKANDIVTLSWNGIVSNLTNIGIANTEVISSGTNYRVLKITSDRENLFLAGYLNVGSSSIDLKFQLEFGSSATSYEEFNGGTDTIALGQTVYGGTLNVSTGLLTIDTESILLNGQQDFIEGSANNNYRWRYFVPQSTDFKVDVDKKKSELLPYNTDVYGNQNANIGFIINGASLFFRLGTEYTTNEAVKTFFSNNNCRFIFPLATPTTVQLTPTEVRTILGQNNIFADTGDVEVTYFKTGCEGIASLIEVYTRGGYTNGILSV